jgi:hypothetical protein
MMPWHTRKHDRKANCTFSPGGRRSSDPGILDLERYREFRVDACRLAIAGMEILGIATHYTIRTSIGKSLEMANKPGGVAAPGRTAA